ncbi:MAG: hypothetical protein ACRCVN_06785 [Spirochaetia bacterium]
MKKCFPVCVWTYNRPNHARLAIEALRANTLSDQTDLYLFSDAPRAEKDDEGVMQTREYLDTVSGFRSVKVIKMESNHGPFKMLHYIGNYMCNVDDAFISVEDDVQTHPFFLQYMNDALNYYRDNKRVFAVSGYTHEPSLEGVLKHYPHDMLFSYAFHAFAWGTWRDRFQSVDWSMPGVQEYLENNKARRRGRVMSWGHLRAAAVAAKANSELWDIRLSYHLLKNDLVCAWPRYSYANNFGFDGSGLHNYTFSEKWFVFPLENAPLKQVFTDDINMDMRFHFGIEVAISAQWVFAFCGNLNRLIKKRVKHLVKSAQAAIF